MRIVLNSGKADFLILAVNGMTVSSFCRTIILAVVLDWGPATSFTSSLISTFEARSEKKILKKIIRTLVVRYQLCDMNMLEMACLKEDSMICCVPGYV